MAEGRPTFDDAESYERFMGQWSRAVGMQFLEWLAPPKHARWLDVGCGTGAFTELILDTCSPAAVVAIDPSPVQIEHARGQPIGLRAEFHVADSQALSFPDGSFDVVASALVINFIPNRPKALAEMRRVAAPGAMVGGYVWDFTGNGEPYAPVRRALSQNEIELPPTAGAEDSSLDALNALFGRAGFKDIATKAIRVARTFADFDDFWQANTPRFHHVGKATIEGLSDAQRNRVIEATRSGLPTGPDGSITCSARANAIRARAP
jgi:ubiquinone/menaquinone biosynthesis C-methylase UbiE